MDFHFEPDPYIGMGPPDHIKPDGKIKPSSEQEKQEIAHKGELISGFQEVLLQYVQERRNTTDPDRLAAYERLIGGIFEKINKLATK